MDGRWFPLDVLLVAVLFQMRKLWFKFQLLPRMEGFKFAVPLNAATVIFFTKSVMSEEVKVCTVHRGQH
jgi:hypothetical protein